MAFRTLAILPQHKHDHTWLVMVGTVYHILVKEELLTATTQWVVAVLHRELLLELPGRPVSVSYEPQYVPQPLRLMLSDHLN